MNLKAYSLSVPVMAIVNCSKSNLTNYSKVNLKFEFLVADSERMIVLLGLHEFCIKL